MGIMVSAFVSREFGFGFHGLKLSQEHRLIANTFRNQPENQFYKDKDAAELVHNSVKNPPLETGKSPFVHFFTMARTYKAIGRMSG